jgi:hypothetical protein
MPWPNFFLMGAAKAGTTALYHALDQHPDLYMSPVKEPNFFAFEGQEVRYRSVAGKEAPVNRSSITDEAAYQALFAEAGTATAVGEASTLYLFSEQASDNIARRLPRARLIALLRHPVDRAYSNYLMNVASGHEVLPFEQALDAEAGRARDAWDPFVRYVQLGMYARQLERYYARFGHGQLLVVLYEDWRDAPRNVLHRVFTFLGIDPGFAPVLGTRHNASGVPRSRMVHSLAGWVAAQAPARCALKRLIPRRHLLRAFHAVRNRNLVRPPLAEATRQRLLAAYHDDVVALQALLGRDLTHWLR